MNHGTTTTYTKHKCRCDACKAAKSAAALRYNEKNRERESARVREWNERNPGANAERVKKWRKANRDKHLANKRERYGYERSTGARQKGIDYDSLWTGTCGVCGFPMKRDVPRGRVDAPTIDHIIPLSKGGAHTPDNLQWAHMGCNSGKGNR